MAYVAACTDKGVKRQTNQDACCIQVAETPFGEIAMAVVCDGVGGLAAGELASATVVYRFVQWFGEELPMLISGMDPEQPFNFSHVQTVWGVLLSSLNETILAYGRSHNERLGTTFTGLLLCRGQYLIGHVGDCRVYQIAPRGVRQVTEDQTLLAKKLAEGTLSPEEAKSFGKRHVILQAVGTEGMLHPAFYKGTCGQTDLFVLCCDGAYKKAEDVGVASFFAGVDHHDEAALGRACQEMLAYDVTHGEKDNLTVVCVSADLAAPGAQPHVAAGGAREDRSRPDYDAPTVVEPDDDLPATAETTTGEDDADLPTVVEPEDDADLPTEVEPEDDGVDDLPTVAEGDEA